MTISVTLGNLANLTNENTAVSTINNNSALITTGFTSALDTLGDKMLGTLDMNSNQIINLPSPGTNNSPVRLTDLTNAMVTGTVVFPIVTGGTNITATGTGTIIISTVSSPTWTSAIIASLTSTAITSNTITTNGIVVNNTANINAVAANSVSTGTFFSSTLTTSGTGIFSSIFANNITGNTTLNSLTVNVTTVNASVVNASSAILTNISTANLTISTGVKIPSVASSSLPSATSNVGYRFICNNATATSFGSTLTGSGSSIVPVYSNGTNWIIG